MRIRTNDGSIIRLIGWKCNPDNLFLLVEMLARVPDSLVCYTVDGQKDIRAVVVRALHVDLEEVARLNGLTLGGGFRKKPVNDA